MYLFINDAGPAPLVNVMLDLETWGTRPGSAIRSIGAVVFEPHGTEIGAEFYANIIDDSCALAGLTRDADTVAWWGRQATQAQDAFAEDPMHLSEVVVRFNDWWRRQRAIFVWSHGANFDEPLWSAASRAVGLPVPWRYWDSRCTRTAYDIAGFDPRTVRRSGTHHNALDDARHQAACVQRAYAKVALDKKE